MKVHVYLSSYSENQLSLYISLRQIPVIFRGQPSCIHCPGCPLSGVSDQWLWTHNYKAHYYNIVCQAWLWYLEYLSQSGFYSLTDK